MDKIKDSEQRRNRRIQHGLQQGIFSDTGGIMRWNDAELMRHKMFRYHTSADELRGVATPRMKTRCKDSSLCFLSHCQLFILNQDVI